MSKFAICDFCGDKDDWSMGKGPFLPDGLLIQFRSYRGGEEIETELEICESCKCDLLKANPKLEKAIEKKNA